MKIVAGVIQVSKSYFNTLDIERKKYEGRPYIQGSYFTKLGGWVRIYAEDLNPNGEFNKGRPFTTLTTTVNGMDYRFSLGRYFDSDHALKLACTSFLRDVQNLIDAEGHGQ